MTYSRFDECLSPRARARGIAVEDVVGDEAADFLEDATDFWNSRNRRIASGAARGALTGFASGGYAGAAVGGVAGGFAASRPTAAKGAAPTPPNPAALQLLATVLRPEIVEALAAMACGRHGAAAVPIAGTRVPVDAVATLIGRLATDAAARDDGLRRDPPSREWRDYLSTVGAEDIDDHAEAVLGLLAEAARIDAGDEEDDEEEDEEDEEDEDDDGSFAPTGHRHRGLR